MSSGLSARALLTGVGISYLGGEADAGKQVTLSSGELMHHDEDVGAVIVGFDRNVNYYKIQYATLCIRENPGQGGRRDTIVSLPFHSTICFTQLF